jgi:hypothetical protein
VLARLDALPGVAAARVDSSGRYFWLALVDGTDAGAVASLATGVLGGRARRLAMARAEAQLEAIVRGDPWLGAGEVMTLSFLESRLLAVRLAGDAAARTGLTPERREDLAEAIRVQLFAAMERVHADGGRKTGGWIYEEWPSIARAALDGCAGPIPPDVRRLLAEILPKLLAR